MAYADNFKKMLADFKSISVREEGTKKLIEEISGRNDISVVCDPVFLLKPEQWLELIAPKTLVDGDSTLYLLTKK